MNLPLSSSELWFGSIAVWGLLVAFLSRQQAEPVDEFEGVFRSSNAPLPTPVKSSGPSLFPSLVLLIICACLPRLADSLASGSALPSYFVSQATAWAIGMGIGVLGSSLALFAFDPKSGESGPSPSACGIALASVCSALAFAPNARIAALFGLGLGWCLVSLGSRQDGNRLLLSSAFAVLLALAACVAIARDYSPAGPQLRWLLVVLLQSATVVTGWALYQRVTSPAPAVRAAYCLGVLLALAVPLAVLISGPLQYRALVVVALGVGTALGLKALLPGQLTESIRPLPPLGGLLLLAGALVSHLVLQGMGMAIWLISAWAIAGFLPDRTLPSRTSPFWILLVAGVLLLQYRLLPILGNPGSGKAEWDDFYFLFALTGTGFLSVWAATSSRMLGVIAAMVTPAVLIFVLGLHVVPAVLLGGLLAVVFSNEKSPLLVAQFGFLGCLLVLPWLETISVFADLPRHTRVGALVVIATVWLFLLAGNRLVEGRRR